MSKNPLVSIAIPVYNGSNYLAEAIDSALAQSYCKVEVIVVNDGSSDGGKTRNIALTYGSDIRYFEKENGGVSSALNYALERMNGLFFSWLSHDDKYYPWKIEKQISYYYESINKDIIVFSHQDLIDSKGKVIKKVKKYSFDSDGLAFTLLYNHFISGCSLLIPKDVFNSVGHFSEKYMTVQDYDMWFRMINGGYQFKYLPIKSGMTRKHGEQDAKTKLGICKDESSNFFIDVQKWLRSDLWLDKWDNKAIAFFYLALQFKKSKLFAVYKYDLKMALHEIKHLKWCQVLFVLLYGIYVIAWNRYLSPTKYWQKLEHIRMSFISSNNKEKYS